MSRLNAAHLNPPLSTSNQLLTHVLVRLRITNYIPMFTLQNIFQLTVHYLSIKYSSSFPLPFSFFLALFHARTHQTFNQKQQGRSAISTTRNRTMAPQNSTLIHNDSTAGSASAVATSAEELSNSSPILPPRNHHHHHRHHHHHHHGRLCTRSSKILLIEVKLKTGKMVTK